MEFANHNLPIRLYANSGAANFIFEEKSPKFTPKVHGNIKTSGITLAKSIVYGKIFD